MFQPVQVYCVDLRTGPVDSVVLAWLQYEAKWAWHTGRDLRRLRRRVCKYRSELKASVAKAAHQRTTRCHIFPGLLERAPVVVGGFLQRVSCSVKIARWWKVHSTRLSTRRRRGCAQVSAFVRGYWVSKKGQLKQNSLRLGGRALLRSSFGSWVQKFEHGRQLRARAVAQLVSQHVHQQEAVRREWKKKNRQRTELRIFKQRQKKQPKKTRRKNKKTTIWEGKGSEDEKGSEEKGSKKKSHEKKGSEEDKWNEQEKRAGGAWNQILPIGDYENTAKYLMDLEALANSAILVLHLSRICIIDNARRVEEVKMIQVLVVRVMYVLKENTTDDCFEKMGGVLDLTSAVGKLMEYLQENVGKYRVTRNYLRLQHYCAQIMGLVKRICKRQQYKMVSDVARLSVSNKTLRVYASIVDLQPFVISLSSTFISSKLSVCRTDLEMDLAITRLEQIQQGCWSFNHGGAACGPFPVDHSSAVASFEEFLPR